MKKLLVTILDIESRLILKKYRPFIVAVTGSVGKTSTKDAIFSVFKGQSIYARKSEKSMNSELGLPLTIIGAPNAWHSLSGWLENIFQGLEAILWHVEYPDCLILEIGADHPGDISRVTRWLKPDIAVITLVSQTPVHVEFFPTPEDVFKEKSALARAVKKGGTLVLFADDEKVMTLAPEALKSGVLVKTYGMNAQADARGSEYAPVYAESQVNQVSVSALVGMSFKLDIEGNSIPITINGAVGSPYVYSLLAAVAAGRARGFAISNIVQGLTDFHAPNGRMNVISGINGSTIIDDSYNSSPDAAESALNTLKSLQCSGHKIAVLGDMLELGKFSSDEHKRIGKLALESADVLITVGQRFKTSFEVSPVDRKIKSFDNSTEASEYVKSVVKAGDIILIKGSQSTRMERVSAALLKEPGRASELLVRQEKEWLEKK